MKVAKDSDLVYSTDPQQNKRCSKCKKLLLSCACKKQPVAFDISKTVALLRLERKHRGGKDVTVVERLPADDKFLKDLSQLLKRKCGSGGTYKITDDSGVIEIQGDKREQVRSEMEKQGIKCR